ncbi:TolC family protein [Flavobacterium luteolum]|uniref:TolC family protein n=1 Tax=Flavobacterium luteolum TaxID=3003259 RepID=UPI00248EE630|nr:TolC family protein [Flavobacterium luteolum]
MKIYITGLIAVLMIHTAKAQQPLTLNMEKAKELALKNRFDVQANRYDTEIAEKEIKGRKQAYIPDLKITGNVSYHPQIQAILVPPGFGGITEPTLLALGAKSISIYSLELNQPILSSSLRNDIKIAENSAQWQAERNRGKEIEIKQKVSEAYLNVLLRDLQQKIALNEEKRYSEYFNLAQGRYDNGALIENDYLRAKLDYQNAKQQSSVTTQNYEISLNTLRHEINVENNVKLELSDKLEDSFLKELPDVTAAQQNNRTEIRQLEFEKIDQNLKLKKQRQSVLPSLSLVANYSQQFQNMEFNYDYTDTQWWSGFSAIGLKLSIPLTEHFTNAVSVDQLLLKTRQTEFNFQQKKADISYEINQAVISLSNAQTNAVRTKDSYDLAQKVYENQQQQLPYGALSYDTILNTESSMTSAEQNYIKASYEFLLAKLNYEMAAGTL